MKGEAAIKNENPLSLPYRPPAMRGHPCDHHGSGDIAAAMRNIIKIEVDKKNPTKRTLRVIESNLDGACFEPVGIRQDDTRPSQGGLNGIDS